MAARRPVHRPAPPRMRDDHFSCSRVVVVATSRVWKFSLTAFRRLTAGAFRVFTIGIRDARDGGDPPSADEMLVCVTTRYQGVLCSCRQRIYEGSVIYDYHCNESPWVFARQIVLPCAGII